MRLGDLLGHAEPVHRVHPGDDLQRRGVEVRLKPGRLDEARAHGVHPHAAPDGFNARYGTISAGLGRFMCWRTVDGETVVKDTERAPVDVLTHGLLTPRVLLDMLRWFTVFEDEGAGPIKKVAGYHQYHAVRKAMERVEAARGRDGKGGVIWHTQGSGKSLLMAFLSGAHG